MRALRLTFLLLALPAVALAENPIPEIDPSSAGTAIMLLSGCVLVYRAGRKK
jgi:hypothetical protein